MLSPSTLARLAPPLFVFLWATGFIAARLVIPYADPLTFLVLRYVLAASLLGLIALAARAPWPAMTQSATAAANIQRRAHLRCPSTPRSKFMDNAHRKPQGICPGWTLSR